MNFFKIKNNINKQKGFTPTPFLALLRGRHTSAMVPTSHDARKGCRGFTLVEMIVAFGLFTAVILISIGALTATISANKKVQSLRVVMDNLNFTTESVARSLRVGSSYRCGGTGLITDPLDCPISGGTSISFRDINGQTVVYRFSGGAIQRSTDGGFTYLDLTSNEITIEKMNFFVNGSVEDDGAQPRVLFIAEGVAGTDNEQVRFNIQTTVSQRPLDT